MKSIKKFLLVVAVIVFALAFSAAAMAAMDSPFTIDNVPNVVGAAVGMVLDYLGSDDYTAAAAPFFRWTLKGTERYLQLNVTELSFNVLNHPNWVLAPVLNYRPGRDDVDDKVVKKMEDIDDTVDAGLSVGYVWRDAKNPRHRFITNLTYYQDIGDTYDGWLVQAGARYWLPVSKPIDVQVGVGATYGSSDYMETYFGVSSKDAAASGLKEFKADSGLRDWNAQLAAVFHFSMSWHMGVGVKYFGLMDDASDSPIVDDRGSSNQWVYGIGLAYSW
ncbi:MAG: MipA/OmpV family protein [Nitrospirota bacterium]|nr:MipA/OmpV family protein [Nitrospirota bacterium]